MILPIFAKIFICMALHLDENIELPNIEVYSSSAELMPTTFQWGQHTYSYVGLQFNIYHIQWCFDEMKMFDFNSCWDVDFLYALTYKQSLNLFPRQVSDMLIETQMPKTYDLEEITTWCNNQTELVLSKCIKVK